jgi:serine phosphatase RsbU (regulator of sigma subunit)/integral membrane sensor domain MASE1/anti-sigma regulatory factor (Ser/Thr protein kinase)
MDLDVSGPHHVSGRRLAVALTIYAAAYWALLEVGLAVADGSGGFALFWPAAAWSLTWFVVWPPRRWPLLIAVQVPVNVVGNVLAGIPLGAAAAFAVPNVVEPLLGAAALLHFGAPRSGSSGVAVAVRALAFAAVLNTMVAGLLGGAASILLFDNDVSLVTAWRTWWVSDAIGIIAFGPLLGLLLRPPGRWWSARMLRGLGWPTWTAAGGAAVIALLVFSDNPLRLDEIVAVCLLVPPLLVAASAGGYVGAAVTIPGVVAVAAWFTARDQGPFAALGGPDAVFDAQVVVGSFAVAALMIGTAVTSLRALAVREAALAAERAALDASGAAARRAALHDARLRVLAESQSSFSHDLTGRFAGPDQIWPVVRRHLPGLLGAHGGRLVLTSDGRPPTGGAAAAALAEGRLVVEQRPPVGQGAHHGPGRVAAALPGVDHLGSALAAVELEWDPGTFDPHTRRYLDQAATAFQQAVMRASLVASERQSVAALQQALLPSVLEPGPEFAVAARYRPGAESLRVGGDWFDVIPLAGGVTAAIVGDVVGRGAEAAAVMGQLRAACRALAPATSGPGELLERLEVFAEDVEGAGCTTVAAAYIDPVANELVVARAGHLPPVIVRPDASWSVLEGGGSPPLGAGIGRARPEDRLPIEAGTMVVLYTDGLVERRGEVLDVGIERLGAAAARAALTPEGCVEQVLEELIGGHDASDDVAILAVRFGVSGRPTFTALIPADFAELAALRSRVADELTGLGTEAGRIPDILLAVTEAATNAMEHAYRHREPGQILVELWRHADEPLTAVVRDFGHWQDEPAVGDRGRGLDIVRLLADLSVDVTARGTTLTMTFAD